MNLSAWLSAVTGGITAAGDIVFIILVLLWINSTSGNGLWKKKSLKAVSAGLRWTLGSHINTGLVFLWPLIAYNIAHLFLGYGSSRRAWREALQDPWQLGGVIFASLVLTLFITAIVKNGALRANPAYKKYAWRIMLAIVIAMILIPWLWRWTDNQIHSQPKPRAAAETTSKEQSRKTAKETTVLSPEGLFLNTQWLAKSKVVARTDGNTPYLEVSVSGRDADGFEVLTLNTGEKVSVTYLEGEVTSFSRTSRENVATSLRGSSVGYVFKNLTTGASWDWSPNYRYSNLAQEGVMPDEMLVVVGRVGSGEEEIFQFPDGEIEVAIVNNKDTPQPLAFYYNALINFYLARTPTLSPTSS